MNASNHLGMLASESLGSGMVLLDEWKWCSNGHFWMKRMQCSKISDAKFTTFCSTQEHLMILIYKVKRPKIIYGTIQNS